MRAERELVQAQERPRVLEFVNTFHFGGTEGQVVELLRGLAPRFELSAAAIQVQGPHVETVRRLGIEPFATPLEGSIARVATARQIRRLAERLRASGVQLVHAHDFYTALLAVPAAKLARVKVVVGRLDLAHWLGTAQRVALALASRAADHVVANAQAIKDQIVDVELLPPERIAVIPNGLDLAVFDRARERELVEPLPDLAGRVAIVHVANMTHPVKAQEDLFEAMRTLQRRRPEALLLLVGDGPRRPALERLAAGLGIERSVRFLGRRGDVPAILARSEVGVLPSHAEGLSNAIIEGMAAGLPMVVTDAGGNAELVRDGINGYVVPVRAPLSLAARLDALVGAPELRVRMGKAGRERVERDLTLEALLRRHEALYREVLARPARG